jgi:hypothetical protein
MSSFVIEVIKLQEMISHTVEIKKYNEVNLVLRHFIQRSARLLPIFAELKTLKNSDTESQAQYQAICDLFMQFNYDDSTSRQLINSDILERIRNTFYAIHNADELSTEVAEQLLSHFFEEYQRLLNNWSTIELN